MHSKHSDQPEHLPSLINLCYQSEPWLPKECTANTLISLTSAQSDQSLLSQWTLANQGVHSKHTDQPNICPVSSIFAIRVNLGYPRSAQQTHWSAWTFAKYDQSLLSEWTLAIQGVHSKHTAQPEYLPCLINLCYQSEPWLPKECTANTLISLTSAQSHQSLLSEWTLAIQGVHSKHTDQPEHLPSMISLCYQREPWLSKECTANTLISLNICQVWSIFAIRVNFGYPRSAQQTHCSAWISALSDQSLLSEWTLVTQGVHSKHTDQPNICPVWSIFAIRVNLGYPRSAQQTHWSAWTSAQSHQSLLSEWTTATQGVHSKHTDQPEHLPSLINLCNPSEPWLPKECTANTLISLTSAQSHQSLLSEWTLATQGVHSKHTDQPEHLPCLISVWYQSEPWLPKECTANTLIRLLGCISWSASVLDTQDILQVFTCSLSLNSDVKFGPKILLGWVSA